MWSNLTSFHSVIITHRGCDINAASNAETLRRSCIEIIHNKMMLAKVWSYFAWNYPALAAFLAGQNAYTMVTIMSLLASLNSTTNPWIYLCFSSAVLQQVKVSVKSLTWHFSTSVLRKILNSIWLASSPLWAVRTHLGVPTPIGWNRGRTGGSSSRNRWTARQPQPQPQLHQPLPPATTRA